jgi:hypothetical protein
MASGGHRIGAGRPGRSVKVEDYRRIDVREWHRAGLFAVPYVGSWQWRSAETGALTSSINVLTDRTSVAVSYFVDGTRVDEKIALDRTRCHFGGDRVWFLCPGCKRRLAILLIVNQRFRCSRCHDIRYRTQSVDAIGRAWIAQGKQEERLLADGQRPKGMHRATHERLQHEIVEIEQRRLELIRNMYIKLLGGLPQD